MPKEPVAPGRLDVGLAAMLAVFSVAELHLGYAFERTDEPGPVLVHDVVALLSAGALAWRRTRPLWVAPVVQVLLTVQVLVVAFPNVYGALLVHAVAVYSLGAWTPSPRAAALPVLVVLVGGVVMGLRSPDDPVGSASTAVVLTLGMLGTGVLVRRSRRSAEDATRERDVATKRAERIAAAERARIARELHDVVAHGMSVVLLQARGGRNVVNRDPDTAQAAFVEIERIAGQCLAEMRRLLGILRVDDEIGPRSPQPDLEVLDELVDQARASGATVTVQVEGERPRMPPALELSAYRIVQEALTNNLRHAPGSAVTLRLTHAPDALSIEVYDNGPGPQPGGGQDGHGLIGMRERVELFGGTLQTGRGPSGGFMVVASLPVREIPS